MYQISVNELALNGIVSKPWDIIYLNRSNKVQSKSNDDNDVYIQQGNSIIPSKGVISISAKSKKELHYELCFTIMYDIPCIRFGGSVTINNKFTGKKLSKKSINKMTTGMSIDDAQIWLAERINETCEYKSENFLESKDLPNKKWIQLNPSDDLFIIQIKLQKTFPSMVYKSVSRNEYWIYKVIKIVLRCRKIHVISPVNLFNHDRENYGGVEESHIQEELMKHKRNICKKQIIKTNKALAKMANKPIHISLI